MSLDKPNYDSFKIVPGCPAKHPSITGEDNSSGKIFDTHKLPERETGWDGVKNSDVEKLSDRIVQLEKKAGLLGWDRTTPVYTLVPKTGSTPAYVQPATSRDKSVVVNKDGIQILSTISDAVHVYNGETHTESLAVLDRCIQVLSHRVLGGLIDPRDNDEIDNFDGTLYNATTVNNTVITGSVTTPRTPTPAATSLQTKKVATTAVVPTSYPKYFVTEDATNEAIAKLDRAIGDLEYKVDEYISATNIRLTNTEDRLTSNEGVIFSNKTRLDVHDTRLADHDNRLGVIETKMDELDKVRLLAKSGGIIFSGWYDLQATQTIQLDYDFSNWYDEYNSALGLPPDTFDKTKFKVMPLPLISYFRSGPGASDYAYNLTFIEGPIYTPGFGYKFKISVRNHGSANGVSTHDYSSRGAIGLKIWFLGGADEDLWRWKADNLTAPGQITISAPAPPTPIAYGVSTSKIVIKWTSVGATSINIEKSTNGFTWTPVATGLPGTATEQEITSGLTSGTNYLIRLQGVNTQGISGWNTTNASTFITSVDAPNAPVDITFIPNPTSVTVGWSLRSESPFVVKYKLASSGTWTTLPDTSINDVSISITGLVSATIYDVEVYAKNSTGGALSTALVGQFTTT